MLMVFPEQDHLLPEEYVQTMRRTTLDQCPVSPYAEVARIVQEELGQPPEALFAEFERAPIASASLAQVLGLFHDGSTSPIQAQSLGLPAQLAVLAQQSLGRLVG